MRVLLPTGVHLSTLPWLRSLNLWRPIYQAASYSPWQLFSVLHITIKLKMMRNFPQLLGGPETTRLSSLLHKPEKERQTQPPLLHDKKSPLLFDRITERKQSLVEGVRLAPRIPFQWGSQHPLTSYKPTYIPARDTIIIFITVSLSVSCRDISISDFRPFFPADLCFYSKYWHNIEYLWTKSFVFYKLSRYTSNKFQNLQNVLSFFRFLGLPKNPSKSDSLCNIS